jgi:hypothetical protein
MNIYYTELKNLATNFNIVKIKIVTPSASSKWENITGDQLAKIQEILKSK